MNKPSAMNEQNSMDKQRSMDKNTEKPTSAAGPAYRPKVVQQRLDIRPRYCNARKN